MEERIYSVVSNQVLSINSLMSKEISTTMLRQMGFKGA